MGDDDKPNVVTDTRASASANVELENPSFVFVKDATRTDASDFEIERNFRDAEFRRDQQAAERAASVTTVDGAVDEGRPLMVTNPLTAHGKIPAGYILLKYLTPGGDDTGKRCLADLKTGTNLDDPTELVLIFICPKCFASKGHQGDCQIQMSQSNKRFEFIAAKGKKMIHFDRGHGPEDFYSAGMIMASERFTCPQCSWSARIDRNRVWPEQ